MQDEVNQKVVTLCINGGKISARILKDALAKLLKKMEQAGLIVRQSMPEDNRRKRIIPTAKAEQARSGVLADIIQLENKLTAHVDDADLAVFFKVMAQMLENMR